MEIDDFKDLVDAFVAETDEVLVDFEQRLIELEQRASAEPVGLAVFDGLLRPFHTFKGNAGMLGMQSVAGLVHAIEEVIKKDVPADTDLVQSLFALLDDLRQAMDRIRGGANDAEELDDWTMFLQTLLESRGTSATSPAQSNPPSQTSKSESQSGNLPAFGFADDLEALSSPATDTSTNVERSAPRDSGPERGPIQDNNLRVSTDKLDRLQREVGELILAFNATSDFVLTDLVRDADKSEFREITDRLDRLANRVRRVQNQTTKIRLLGLSSILRRVPRIARDAAKRSGKTVQAVIEGENTEADKSVVDQLSEVIVHLVRNAVDHGIEDAKARKTLEKPETGLVVVRAQSKGDHIQIDVEDDGAGIDLDVVRDKAVKQGIVSKEEAAQADRDIVLRWLFSSGFSTKDQATELSGRGVGLDVVDQTVRALGGTVHLESTKNEGSRFVLSVPISTAVAELLHVEIKGHVLSIPMRRIIETQRLDEDRVTEPGGTRRYRWRDDLVPLIELGDWLPEANAVQETNDEHLEQWPYAVILEHGASALCIRVEGFSGKSQAVLHPLGDAALNGGPFSGATVLGNGFVSLILDPERLYGFIKRQQGLV